MSEIQDEAYTELCQENKWLSKQLADLKFLNAEERATIDELAKLCLRAADALEKVASYVSGDPDCYRILRLAEQELIAELRKATE